MPELLRWSSVAKAECLRLFPARSRCEVPTQSECLLQHASNAATSSQTSVGGGSGAGGSAGGGSAGSGGAAGGPRGPGAASTHHHHHHSGTKFRHGLLQLMIHTIDPLHDGEYRAARRLRTRSAPGPCRTAAGAIDRASASRPGPRQVWQQRRLGRREALGTAKTPRASAETSALLSFKHVRREDRYALRRTPVHVARGPPPRRSANWRL